MRRVDLKKLNFGTVFETDAEAWFLGSSCYDVWEA